MNNLWYLLLFIPVILLFVPISVFVGFNNDLNLIVRLLGIKMFDYNKQKKKADKSDEKKKENRTEEKKEEVNTSAEQSLPDKAQGILKQIKAYFALISEALRILNRHIKKTLHIQNFRFEFSFGLGDAAATGIFSGAAYAVGNCFYAYLLNNYKVKRHELKIAPDFDKKGFSVLFELKLKVSLFWLIRLLYKERHVLSKLYIISKKKDGV